MTLPEALAPLKGMKHWLNYRNEETAPGKTTKKPYQSEHPNRYAKPNDSTTWSTFEAAIDAVEENDFDGIGFCLKDSGFAALDCDDVLDKRGNITSPMVQQILKDNQSLYCEITPSGRGLRFIGKANGPEMHRILKIDNGAKIELYRRAKRYITVTGQQVNKTKKLGYIDDVIDQLSHKLKDNKPTNNKVNGQDHGGEKDTTNSGLFFGKVAPLIEKGYSPERVERECRKKPNYYYAQKYIDKSYNELTRMVGLAFRSIERKQEENAEEPINAEDFEAGQIRSLDQAIAKQLPTRYLFPKFLQRGRVYFFVGAPGHGKTALAVALSVAAASGKPWGDFQTSSPGHVLWLAGEAYDDTLLRFSAILKTNKQADLLRKRIHIVDCQKITDASAYDLMIEFDRIEAYVKAHCEGESVMIVLDTALDFFMGDDDNAGAAVNSFMKEVHRLALELPGTPTIVALSHVSKSAASSGGDLSPIGSTRYSGKSDGVLAVRLNATGISEYMPQSKWRGPRWDSERYFENRLVKHGETEDGDPIFTTIADPVDPQDVEEEEEALTPEVHEVLNVLTNAPQSAADIARVLEWERWPTRKVLDAAIERGLVVKVGSKTRGSYKLTADGQARQRATDKLEVMKEKVARGKKGKKN